MMQPTPERRRVDVVVAGHRDLFGTPRALEHAGLLRHLVTDLYVGKGSVLHPLEPLLRFGPRSVRKLLARDSGLPGRRIVANNLAGLRSWRALRGVSDPGAASILHQRLARELGESLLRRCPPFADAVVGYRMSDWLFARLPGSTAKLLCQNDGGAHEVGVVAKVWRENPEWRSPAEQRATPEEESREVPEWLHAERARLKEEWRLSTTIVCWSEWCVRCVTAEGVPREKCVVVPPTFSPSPAFRNCEPRYDRDPFTIVFLGTLCLRKGIHDLIQAVSMAAESVPVRLILAGPNQTNPEKLRLPGGIVDYRGTVPHGELPALFSDGHVLVLPSYSEGFAMVQLEAMAAGLPVLRSTRTGESSRDGVEGYVFEPGDREALAAAIVKLARDRALLREMGTRARRRVDDFNLEACSGRWSDVVDGAAASLAADGGGRRA